MPASLPHRALGLRVPAVADHHDLVALAQHLGHLHVHLGHQRAGGVEHLEPARLGVLAHRLRDAVGAENHRGAGGHLVELLDEHGALAAQLCHHGLVVDNLMAHVDRRAVLLERALDDVDGALDPGAEAARFRQQDVHGRHSSPCA